MRRLVERGPHTVTVTPMRTLDDGLGQVVAKGEPVTLSGVMVQPISAPESDLATGTVGAATWRVIGAGIWPGGPYASIRVDVGPPGLQGRIFDQVGDVQARASGRRTHHFVVAMSAHGQEVH